MRFNNQSEIIHHIHQTPRFLSQWFLRMKYTLIHDKLIEWQHYTFRDPVAVGFTRTQTLIDGREVSIVGLVTQTSVHKTALLFSSSQRSHNLLFRAHARVVSDFHDCRYSILSESGYLLFTAEWVGRATTHTHRRRRQKGAGHCGRGHER